MDGTFAIYLCKQLSDLIQNRGCLGISYNVKQCISDGLRNKKWDYISESMDMHDVCKSLIYM